MDFMPYWHHSKTRTIKRLYLSTAPPQYLKNLKLEILGDDPLIELFIQEKPDSELQDELPHVAESPEVSHRPL
jgi:hypothetical protein